MTMKLLNLKQTQPAGTLTLTDGYKIIVSNDGERSGERISANKIAAFFKWALETEIPVCLDEDTPIGDKEIIVGVTNRHGIAYTTDDDALGESGYILAGLPGESLLLYGFCGEGAMRAYEAFMDRFVLAPYKNGEKTITVPSDLWVEAPETPKVGSVKIAGTDLSEFVIVRAEFAPPPQVTAAKLLQKFLRRATGVSLKIVHDGKPRAAHEIIVGKTNREHPKTYTIDYDRYEENDGFMIRVTGGNLVIAGGGPRGTIYGVYTFLEEQIGYRWYERFKAHLFTSDTIELAEGFENEQMPVFYDHRGTTWLANYDNEGDGFYLRNKQVSDRWQKEEFGGSRAYPAFHSFRYYYPEKTDVQPCLTDEDTYQLILGRVRKHLFENPSFPGISISQNDIIPACPCENCRASDAKYGQTGTFLNFVNRIADDLKEDFPKAWVHTFAYLHTIAPPKGGVRCRDNVFVQFSPILECYSHSVDEECFGDFANYNRIMKKYLEEWGKIAPKLWIWEYTDVCNETVPNYNALIENFEIYAKNGAVGLYAQGSGNNFVAEAQDLRAYLYAKLMWNPYLGKRRTFAIMDEYLEYYYGPGWRNLREYIDVLEALGFEHHFHMGPRGAETSDIRPLIDRVTKLFDAAEAAAPDFITLAHIQVYRIAFETRVLNETYEDNFVNGTEEQRAAYDALNRHLYRRMKQYCIFSPDEEPNFKNPPKDWRVWAD